MKIPKPKQKTIRKSGRVSLLLLTRPDGGGQVYAVRYPHKVGNEEGQLNVMAQFMNKNEAVEFFDLMTQFYVNKAHVVLDMQEE